MATVQLARLVVTSTATVTTVQMARLQVKASTAATVQMSRLEVNTAGLAGRWIKVAGALVPLTAAGYPRAAVVTPPVVPPPSGAYVPPSYGPLGSYVPGSGTAGVIRPRTTTLTGNRTLSTPNVEYRDVIFDGAVTIAAAGLIFRNCEFRGGAPLSSGNFCVMGSGNNLFNALFEDCLIKPSPANETQYMNGVYGTGYTMRRCEITRSVDGVSIVSGGTANNTLIEGCWIHNTSWISPASTQSDNQTHNDGIQFHSQGQGSNITIRYNMIGGVKVQAGATQTSAEHAASDDCNNSCFMIQQEVSSASTVQINNVDIYGNTLQGGATRINIAYKNLNNLSGVRIGPNKFIRSTWAGGGGYYILRMTAATPVLDTANQLFTDTGLPVPIQVI